MSKPYVAVIKMIRRVSDESWEYQWGLEERFPRYCNFLHSTHSAMRQWLDLAFQQQQIHQLYAPQKPTVSLHVVSTKRTILSPFTKEYHVLATYSGIRPFLEGDSYGIIIPYSSSPIISSNFILKNEMMLMMMTHSRTPP
ncbi:hypothetical protein POM88_017427 [Heracleum sosnowskyi]|uniref:Uncharacterized protein n=1 Tax=Heracleum sosnowskyi TaxID=360622 RepID=A0AAD8IRQ5_9APIA|nr:hypothetical protein POM88_017425 [Heracleum sosnowskyi]KAK1389249.1 hypothetical protein POM88_017427 [Heracleum sosnowskyi]